MNTKPPYSNLENKNSHVISYCLYSLNVHIADFQENTADFHAMLTNELKRDGRLVVNMQKVLEVLTSRRQRAKIWVQISSHLLEIYCILHEGTNHS